MIIRDSVIRAIKMLQYLVFHVESNTEALKLFLFLYYRIHIHPQKYKIYIYLTHSSKFLCLNFTDRT